MKLPDSRLAVLVSLPRNDVALAAAARRAGADGLKVHVSMSHRASGREIGTLAEERSRVSEVMGEGLPTGIVVGRSPRMAQEIAEAVELGVDYLDQYASDAPADYVDLCAGATAMIALGPTNCVHDARALVRGGVGALELSTLEPERYGSPLSLGTLARLEAVADEVTVPVVLPSQHRLEPGDLRRAREAGACAVLLGAVVLGEEADELEARLAPFVEAAASL